MRTKVKDVYFDWNEALGDTISEKYEALYLFINDMTKLLPEDKGQVTLQCAETLYSIFDSFHNFTSKPDAPLFVNGIMRYMGEINNKWAMWLDPFMSFEELWVMNDSAMVIVRISNFEV